MGDRALMGKPARACTDDLIMRSVSFVTKRGTFRPCSRPCQIVSESTEEMRVEKELHLRQ